MQKMIDAQLRDMKLYFTQQLANALKPINEEIASLKLELQARNKDIDNLKFEIKEIKSVNKELIAANESLKTRMATKQLP